MGSILYFYDQSVDSHVQWPPQFHRKWLIGDFNEDWIKWTTPREVEVTRSGITFPVIEIDPPQDFLGIRFPSFLDLKFGPDGALYVNNYAGWFNSGPNTSIVRVEYVGPEPSEDCILNALGEDIIVRARTGRTPGNAPLISFAGVSFFTEGPHELRIMDINGRLVYSQRGSGTGKFSFSSLGRTGLFVVTVESEHGVNRKRVPVYENGQF
jgi:hypothetical protein